MHSPTWGRLQVVTVLEFGRRACRSTMSHPTGQLRPSGFVSLFRVGANGAIVIEVASCSFLIQRRRLLRAQGMRVEMPGSSSELGTRRVVHILHVLHYP